MSNIYSKRATFEIARNHELNITVIGCWYRSNATEYFVSAPERPHVEGERKPDRVSRGFTNLGKAMSYFEQLTDPSYDPAHEADMRELMREQLEANY